MTEADGETNELPYSPTDGPCLTRVPAHGFTRKRFAGDELNSLSASCLTGP
jgi:hypothetical protein